MAIFITEPFIGIFSIFLSLLETNAIEVGYLNMHKNEQIG